MSQRMQCQLKGPAHEKFSSALARLAAVVQQLIANLPNPSPLIAVTGYGQSKDRERGLKFGFHSNLTKPVDSENLALVDNQGQRKISLAH